MVVSRNLPARYPPGPWPGQMRADMVAAFLDFENTADLAASGKAWRSASTISTSQKRRQARTGLVTHLLGALFCTVNSRIRYRGG
jgi:heme/copper-type cytochrome/quinol oxidase subunit 3